MKSTSQAATARFAKTAACAAGATVRDRALVYALAGELGTGKTTFTKAFAKALGVTGRVTSPSFLIMKHYPLPRGKTFVHIDAYRLNGPEELSRLGFQNLLEDPDNIIVVEWADKVKDVVPKDARWLRFEHGERENERLIE